MNEFEAESVIREAENILHQARRLQKREEQAAVDEAKVIMDDVKYPGLSLKLRAFDDYLLVASSPRMPKAFQRWANTAVSILIRDLSDGEAFGFVLTRLSKHFMSTKGDNVSKIFHKKISPY